MRIFVFLLLSLLSINSYSKASSNKEYLYHCPNFEDTTYEHGQFGAETNYDGLQTRWFSVRSFPEKTLAIGSFIRAAANSCIGGLCEIECVYHPASRSGDYVFLEIPYGAYRVNKTAEGPWAGDHCESKNPSDCKFYLVNNPI